MSDPRLRGSLQRLGPGIVKEHVKAAQAQARAGDLPPAAVVDVVLSTLPAVATSLVPVINATGVVIHTNLGRASLSQSAREAMNAAAGYVTVEFDLEAGTRGSRGEGARSALRKAVPAAEDALVVNNGAAAVVLATTALAAGRDVIVSRGEMVEIGDGFRLPALIESTGARLREVGTTNRTHLRDYADAVDSTTGCILKVHPSNFQIAGFTSGVGIAELARLGVPLVADIGSGLLAPNPRLPDEPDAQTTAQAGASVVTCSGDKLLGGPQAGLIFGRKPVVEQLRRHPLARAMRADKLTLAALEATVRGPATPVQLSLLVDPQDLRRRCARIAAATGGEVVPSDGVVGGGAGPGQSLPGWAVALDQALADRLRRGRPSVIGRVERGRCLLDLRCVPPADDAQVTQAVLACMS
jgi:L-seryl-tRNA(Ser) seleniumtransferase